MAEISPDSVMVLRRGRGRPPRRGVASTKILQVRLTGAEHLDLQSAAREMRLAVTEVVREAVDEYVSDFREGRVFRR